MIVSKSSYTSNRFGSAKFKCFHCQREDRTIPTRFRVRLVVLVLIIDRIKSNTVITTHDNRFELVMSNMVRMKEMNNLLLQLLRLLTASGPITTIKEKKPALGFENFTE